MMRRWELELGGGGGGVRLWEGEIGLIFLYNMGWVGEQGYPIQTYLGCFFLLFGPRVEVG